MPALTLAVLGWLLRRSPWAWAGLLGSAAAAYAGLASLAATPAHDDISRWLPRRDLRVEGVLVSAPEEAAGNRGWVGVLACRTAVWHGLRRDAGGRLRFFAPGPRPDWNPGDEIAVTGRLEAVAAPTNPGEFNLRAFYARQGIRARLSCRERGDAFRLARAGPGSAGWWAGALRRRLQTQIQRAVRPRAAPLVMSLVLGDRSRLQPQVQETMAAAGLAHVLAVSGMNVSLVWTSLFFLVRALGLPRRGAVLLALAGVWVFALAAGAGPSVTRAAWMATGMALGFMGERRADPESGLAFAGLLLMAASPLTAGDAGFQLSFAATAAILAGWPGRAATVPTRPPAAAVGRWLMDSLRVTGAAWAGTAPLCWYYFSSVTPAALFSNLAAAPLVAAATYGGLLLGLCGGGWAGLDQALGGSTGGAARFLLGLAEWSAGWPWGRIFAAPPSAAWVGAFYLAAAVWRIWPGRRLAFSWILLGLLAAAPGFAPAAPAPGTLRVTFLNLNLGEAALLESGRSRVLVDTGSETEFLWRVKPYLAAQGIRRLDALVLSHGDDDHAGGLAACLRAFKPRAVFAAEPLRSRRADRSAAPRLGAGDRLAPAPGIAFEVLWPPPRTRPERNQNCLVLRVEGPGGGIILTGDSPEGVEWNWDLPNGCAVLKCGHHGARTSTGQSLLLRAAPRIAVVTPGARNPYGFPHAETLARLARHAGQTLRTDIRGAIQVELSAEGLRWGTWR